MDAVSTPMDTADAMDPAALHAALARFDAACAKVEGALEELGGGPSGDAYKRACTTGVRAFMDVKEASRKSYLEISKIQAVVGERRKVLDDQHLQLQNFQYREFRLSEEVKLCREFTCGQLERIEADEGASMARFLGGGAVDGAEHAERLGLLQAELEARRRLLAEREGLETTRATMEADGKRRRAFLRDLPERLTAVKDALKGSKVGLGAQDCYAGADAGAFTGATSTGMLESAAPHVHMSQRRRPLIPQRRGRLRWTRQAAGPVRLGGTRGGA